ncbi:CYTH domain-containing protein [Symbiobacterium thermophilum]|uniref:CYTH domain-containing protein n=1 Tax=Symbiobacterium thermophilum (strain DSM 24528 / JCM 14929 / IAM 14863 / T) TaxID=292459 RepID=Q67S73_SYMTH|nr:CYTH domain-containing protein [Symbiobacterium thermophilum]BAD39470.1 conserved hypothetical protein [Symbiobacterium thermophilum IAM 14863]
MTTLEVEIKLAVPPTVPGGPGALFERLAAQETLAGFPLGAAQRVALRDTYFDTDDGTLAGAGAGLRVRREDGRTLITLKVTQAREDALTRREEYEAPLDLASLREVVERIRPLIGPGTVPFAAFAAGRPAGPLEPVLDVRTERIVRTVGNVATLSLDRVLYPGLAPEPYYDIEVEAAPGLADPAVLRALEAALTAAADGHLRPEGRSKLERGLALLRRR